MHAVKGTTVCRMHGGTSPQVKAKVAEKRIEAEVSAALERLGNVAPVENPLAELLQIAGEARAWLSLIRDRAAALIDADTLTSWSSEGGEEIKAVVRLYERALDRAAGVVARASQLKVEERLSALMERDLERVESVLEAMWVAGRSGLDLDQARADASRRLRLVS